MDSRPRTITPHVPVETVMGGLFEQGPAYTNWRPSGSGDWLIIHTLEGAGRIVAKGVAHSLGPGALVLYHPNAPQDYSTDPDTGHWRLQWAHFQPRPDWLGLLRWQQLAPGVGHRQTGEPETTAAVAAAFDRMLVARRRDRPGATDLALNALEEALLWIESDASARSRPRIDARVRLVMDYLASHLEEPFSLQRLARHCALSPSRLGHLFTEALGMSPQRYAEQVKLLEAKRLLAHTGQTVAQVANAIGFADPLYFSKRFRRFAGAPPSIWRRHPSSGLPPRPPSG